jgi:hypothetical protein
VRLALFAVLVATPCFANDGEDVVQALLGHCMTPLETGAPLAYGLTRAAPEMEVKLLDGKAAQVFRTANPKIVVVPHDNAETCEIMALGLSVSEFDAAFRAWLASQASYRVDAGAKMGDDIEGGAYIARALDAGYVQAFIQTHPQSGFIGITAARVAQSAQAEELLAAPE